MEKRNIFIKKAELRSTENEKERFLEGVIPYEKNSEPIYFNNFTEVIERTAFSKTLNDKKDVKCFWNHDDSKVLGSTKAGTLELDSKEDGLHFRCKIGNSTFSNDAYDVISRGDVNTLSFGFIPVKQEIDKEKKEVRLKEVKLLEISVGVAFPAYPDGKVETQMRSLQDAFESLSDEDFEKVDKELVKDLMDTIKRCLPKDEKAVENEPSIDTQNIDTLSDDKQSEKIKEDEKRKLCNLIKLELLK